MAPTELEINVSEEEGVTIVALRGPVDSATIEAYKAALDPVFRHKNARILVDCADLSYINSRGIGMLSSYHRQCMVNMSSVAVCGVMPRIQRNLSLLGLDKKIKIAEDRAGGLAILNG